ncbi:MAG: hypothetical protein ACLTKI_08900 [Lachnospiraceae bacterium]
MNQTIKRICILLGIFVMAVAVYFIWNINRSGDTNTVYTTMEEAKLPVVYMEMLGKERNISHGYTQDMGELAGDSLTILPADRKLTVQIRENTEGISGIRYEVRSLDGEHLVERTSLENWETLEDSIQAELPIQNLLTKDQQYLLTLFLNVENAGEVRYYTRILWTDDEMAQPILELAEEFSAKTYDYEQAQDLVTYLESSDKADNSNLGQVTIKCSFDQITWGGLGVVREQEPLVTLKEMDGIMGEVSILSLASRQLENGEKEFYEVNESFTMKWSAQRIYLMNYTREVNEIFTGRADLFSGKRIMLGIGNEDNYSSIKSKNNRFLGFVTNRDFWVYDHEEQKAERVFSFRSGEDSGIRSNYDQHGVKPILVQDNGDADFLVYGYMNRGRHEGASGVALYHYDSQADTIEERFFTSSDIPFVQMEQDIRTLAYLGTSNMLYFMLDCAVYGIDLNSNEYMVVANNLTEGMFAVSQDGKRLAWQEGTELYGAPLIHLMDLDSGRKDEIPAGDGNVVRVLGFVGSDFVYGLATPGEEWIQNGRVEELPMYALEIAGEDMKVATHYELQGYRIAGVSIVDSRIHLKKLVQLSTNEYTVSDSDIIVCNAQLSDGQESSIGWYASPEKKRVYFVQTNTDIPSETQVRVSAPRKLTYDHSEILSLASDFQPKGSLFYAYGNGEIQGITQDPAEAIALAYEGMGYVCDQYHQVIWSRVNRGTAKTLRDPGRPVRNCSGIWRIFPAPRRRKTCLCWI